MIFCIAGESRPDILEYKVKASFIEKFTRFITWPENQYPDAPFVIGIVGTDGIEPYLQEICKTRKINGRNAVIKIIDTADQIDGCSVIYIPRKEQEKLPAIVQRAAGRPMLTVSDCAECAKLGVLINFYEAGEYLRFEINIDSVGRSGLGFSSKLLQLARIVR